MVRRLWGVDGRLRCHNKLLGFSNNLIAMGLPNHKRKRTSLERLLTLKSRSLASHPTRPPPCWFLPSPPLPYVIWRVPNPPGANPLVAERAPWRSSRSCVTGGQQPIGNPYRFLSFLLHTWQPLCDPNSHLWGRLFQLPGG